MTARDLKTNGGDDEQIHDADAMWVPAGATRGVPGWLSPRRVLRLERNWIGNA